MSLALMALLLVATGPTVNVDAIPAKASTGLFTDIKNNYPKPAVVSDTKLKTVMSLSSSLSINPSQSSALRMSHALNAAAAHSPGASGIDRSVVKSCPVSSKNLNSLVSGNQQIYHVRFFDCYLKAEWVAPDVANVNSILTVTTKQGVLIFTDCSAPGLERIDLWDQTHCTFQACPASEFATHCSKVQFYELS